MEEIESEQIDLVIMGSRGYGPLFGPLLGSVSQRVLSKAKCPVMIILSRKPVIVDAKCRIVSNGLAFYAFIGIYLYFSRN